MIPPLAAFLAAHAHYARAHRITLHQDEARIAEALREATELSGGRAEDEPAALLFALTARPRALGEAWKGFPVLCAANLARSTLGAELRVRFDDPELEDLRLRVVVRRASFEEVRTWIATHLRPLR